jgi:hypothetical protein
MYLSGKAVDKMPKKRAGKSPFEDYKITIIIGDGG